MFCLDASVAATKLRRHKSHNDSSIFLAPLLLHLLSPCRLGSQPPDSQRTPDEQHNHCRTSASLWYRFTVYL